jgi:hypothetical protein
MVGPTRRRVLNEQLTRTSSKIRSPIDRMDKYESVISEVVFGEKQAVRKYSGRYKGCRLTEL